MLGVCDGCLEVCVSWLLLLDDVELATFLLGCIICLPFLVSSMLGAHWYRIVRVASSAAHKATVVFCRTWFVSSVDTVWGGEDDGEEASESGL